ncbi:MAG: AIPR family protein [Bacteroidota bacterium]
MTAHQRRHSSRVPFFYHTLRNISAPEDVDAGRRVYAGIAPATSFVDLPEDENVRTYIVTAEGKKRQRLTDVHRRIRDTLDNKPNDFVILNSGIVIVARDVEVDEKTKKVNLETPSIINGSQTRGELEHYLSGAGELFPVSCKFELVVTDDDDLIAEVSIARNFQNDVATLSIAGRKGVLDELEDRLQKASPELQLRKSETQRSEDYYDTEKLLQVITALIPAELWPKPKERDDPKKVYTYSMKAKCLKDFQETYNRAKDPASEGYHEAKALYNFYLDIAPIARELYEKWKRHPDFSGTGIRSIEREGRQIIDVPDGIIFPILASLSAFAKKVKGKWTIVAPQVFNDSEIIHAAKAQYMNVAHSNPWNMGKNQAIYSSLFQITNIYKKVSSG